MIPAEPVFSQNWRGKQGDLLFRRLRSFVQENTLPSNVGLGGAPLGILAWAPLKTRVRRARPRHP